MWINGASRTQAISLSTNSDRSYLRIRIRSGDEEDSENDSGKANQRDIKFKVRHIAKIGTEREPTSERKDGSNKSKSKSKVFVIKMKYPVGEFTKFKFVAQSLPERDSALLAIKGLLDQGKQNAPTKSQPIESETRHESNVKSLKSLQISERRDPVVDDDVDSFGIPAPNNMCNTDEEDEIFYDTRDDTHFGRQADSEREGARVLEKSSKESSFSRRFDNAYRPSTPQHKMNRNKPKDWTEKKTTDNSRRTATNDMAGPTKNRQRDRSHSKTRAERLADLRKKRIRKAAQEEMPRANRVKSSMREMTESETPENKFGRIPSQAFAAFEDVDISKLAPNFAAPEIGPWCTDDICAASLKDFADSMAGIFDVSDNRGISNANKVQRRVKAEEYITGFLGNNANMGDLFSVRDLWDVASRKHATGKEIKRLQNRARKSSGQAIRFQNLRKQMTFKGADERNVSALQTISSFDDAVRKARQNHEDNELLYYDSDPEDARERTLAKGPRKVMARRKDSNIRGKRKEALNILDTSRSMTGRKFKRCGQDVLSDIIEVSCKLLNGHVVVSNIWKTNISHHSLYFIQLFKGNQE